MQWVGAPLVIYLSEYAILPELKFRTSWSLDNASEYENNFISSLLAAGVVSNGSAASYETKNLVLTNEQVLTYIKSFGEDGKHSINALVGNTINTVFVAKHQRYRHRIRQ